MRTCRNTACMTTSAHAHAMRIRVRSITVVIALTALIAACSGQPTVGVIEQENTTTTLAIPAMWAAEQSDGSLIGGIEPAQVIVERDVDPSYNVDLASIEAEGAGPAWRAATASAAAFATLFAGVDPRRIGLDFTVTGPIDGPSAGAILTVGLLAAFRQTSLLDGVTMTGTIAPDGSVGAVGYIPTKFAAAAEAGYSIVGYPADAINPSAVMDSGMTFPQYAASLGVTAVPLRNIGEAYSLLTGGPAFYSPAAAPPLSQSMTMASIDSAARLRIVLNELIMSAPIGTDKATLATAKAASQLPTAQTSPTMDYGSLAYAGIQLSRAIAAQRTTSSLAAGSLQTVRTELIATARSVEERAMNAIEQSTSTVGPAAMVAEAAALGWATYARASMTGAREELTLASEPDVVVTIAESIAEQSFSLNALMPGALAACAAVQSDSNYSESEIASMLDAYSSFLVQSADARMLYATSVLRTEPKADGTFSNEGFGAAAVAAGAYASDLRAIPTSSRTGVQAVRGLAEAMTYLWFTNAAVAARQIYGADGTATGGSGSSVPETMRSSVMAASGTVDALATLLHPRRIDPSAALWSSQWATSMFTTQSDTDAWQAAWIAQGELWYADVQVLLLNALTAPEA